VVLAIICVVIFLVVGKKQKRICGVCGTELLDTWIECPNCAKRRAEEEMKRREEQQKINIQPVIIQPVAATLAAPINPNPNPGAGGKTQVIRPPESTILAYLIVKEGQRVGHSFQLTGETTAIGRAAINDVSIDDATVSSQHAKILLVEGKFFIHDLASANGTSVNSKKVIRQEILDGDEILMGGTKLIFKKIN
jgi:pSer/pThr/pTyr-binding forkhead associated (FHA) protein